MDHRFDRRTRGIAARGVATLATVSLLATGVVTGTAHAAPPAPTPAAAPATPATAPNAAAASSAARRAGVRVEVEAARSETGQVFANPDGTFTAVESVQPVRVRRGDGWVPVDLTLRAARDGTLRPVAAPTFVALSGGGTADLVRLNHQGREVALAWPDRLPTPTVEGPQATYPEVYPGVDLVVTVDASGFSQVLVVRTRAAAADPRLAQLRLIPRVGGGTLRVDAASNATVVDADGATVFAGPPPRMWDASGQAVSATDRLAGVATGARQAAMPSSIEDGALVVRPDRALLTAATTTFPVYLDPALHWAGGRQAWTAVWKAYPNGSYFNAADVARVGYESQTGMTNRSFFQMNSTNVRGKHIISATLRTFEEHAWSCSARQVEVWRTGAISSATTWNRQPAWSTKLYTANVAKGYSASCPAGGVDFPVTAAVVSAAAANASSVTFGLKATNETDTYAWKKFRNNPTLEVTYNTPPSAAADLSIDGMRCPGGTNTPIVIGKTTPRFYARISDPDRTNVGARFEWWNTGGAKIGEKVTAAAASGTAHSALVPTGHFANGRAYSWRVRAEDGVDVGPWSEWCELAVDTTRPVEPQVTSATYPETGPGADPIYRGGKGVSGTFTFTPGAGDTDVVKYRYGLNVYPPPPASDTAANATTKSLTVTLTPTTDLANTLWVSSIDRAGNVSVARGYQFFVRPVTFPTGHWPLDERSGTTAADVSGDNRTGAASGTVNWTTGRVGVGAGGFGGGSIATAGPVLRTDASFTVSAWVRLNATFANFTAVSQDGAMNSAFYLRYDGEKNRWAMEMNTTDDANEVLHRALSVNPPGYFTWTHLVGVYDKGAGVIKLYVDGVLQSTVPHTGAWNATGALQIGRGKWRHFLIDHWNGDIDDVRVFQGVLPDPYIAELARPPAALVAHYTMDETSGTTVADATGGGRTATTVGAASRADGWIGGSLVLDGTTGAASTASSVIRTDQSFAVTAWVRLNAGASVGNVTAVSQDGNEQSGFKLQYVPLFDRWALTLPSFDGQTDESTAVYSTQPVVRDAWTHLAGVYDANAHQLKLYVDGVLVGYRTDFTQTWHAPRSLQIGRALWRGWVLDYWPGAVDDVRVYQGALYDEDVALLAQAS